jgi:5-methylcytosine-specific restriction endonuclease McrA
MPGRYRLVVGQIVPAERYEGRHDDTANLRTMCVSCNNSQRDLADEQWREAREARGQPIGRPTTGGRTILDKPAQPPRIC